MPRTSTVGGGTNARSRNQGLAETGSGLPDESVGPEQRTLPERADLGAGVDAEALAEKLRREADSFLSRHGRSWSDGEG